MNRKIFLLLIIFTCPYCNSLTQTVTDIDGNVYNTVTIGSQVWLKENLKVTHYNNGDSIPNITDNTAWASLNTPAYCWYNNDYDTYGTVYGALYNWFTTDSASNGNKNLCPLGWHIPTSTEWTTLTTYLGGESVAGGKMKEAGTAHWSAPNTGATNESDFTALPGGYRGYVNGSFNYIGIFGHWWSNTQYDTSLAWGRGLFYLDAPVNNSTSVKKNGFCIRCMKDPVNQIDDENNIESMFILYQNYPNPFNPLTQITYSIPKATNVTLKVYDILGQEIAILVNERKQTGEYNMTWNAEGVPSGVYYYRIVAGDFIETKKMLLIR
jgi:uncharacterized protein (TIGR02145 family)